MAYLKTSRILITIVIALYSCGADSAAALNFWITATNSLPSGSSPPASSELIPNINRGLQSSGTLYIWARPDANKVLQNWSLNIVSSNPSVVQFQGADIGSYNPAFSSPPQQRWEHVGEPQRFSPVASLNRLQGFTIFDEGRGIGYASSGNPMPDPLSGVDLSGDSAWLIGEVSYLTGTTEGTADVQLQIGDAGANHQNQAISGTMVVLGALDNGPLDAGMTSNRSVSTGSPELSFNVVEQTIENADFDTDGQVDGLDFLLWQQGFGTSSGPGDANGNQQVDIADLAIWEQQYGVPQSSVASAFLVPEPSSGWVALVLMLIATLWPRRRRADTTFIGNRLSVRSRYPALVGKQILPTHPVRSMNTASWIPSSTSLPNLIGLVALCCATICSEDMRAQTNYTWSNPTGGDWFASGNWAEPGGPNSHSHNATIDLMTGTPYVVSLNNSAFVSNFTLDSQDANLEMVASPGNTLLDVGGSELNLLSGSISGPAVFKVNSLLFPAVTIGSPTDLVGDFTLDFFETNNRATLNTSNDELIAGQIVNIYETAGVTAIADTFVNNSEIYVGVPRSTPLGTNGIFEISNGGSIGVLENNGLLSVPSGLAGAGLFLSLQNKPTGIVNFSASSNQLARLGDVSTSTEVHLNEGLFTSNRETFIHGDSFTNTGDMQLNAGAGIDTNLFHHSGGTLVFGGDVTFDASMFQVSGGASLQLLNNSRLKFEGVYAAGSSAIELLAGSVTGTATFDIETAVSPQVIVGSDSNFSGDFTLNFNPINDNQSQLTVIDDQLLAGRRVNVFRSTDLTLNASSFTNHGTFEVGRDSPLQTSGVETKLIVHDGISSGTFVNYGLVTVQEIPPNASMDFTLHNMPTGAVNISSVGGGLDKIGIGVGEEHINQGHITSRRNLLVRGESFTNSGTMAMRGTISDFQVNEFAHEDGTISLNNNLLRVNSFRLTNGAMLNGSFSRGLQVRSSELNDYTRQVHLENGSISGGMGVELNGNVNLRIGPSSDLTGDFNIFVKRGFGGTPTVIQSDDNTLPNGRAIIQENGGTLDIEAAELANHGTISMKSTSFDPRIRISSQGAVGRLTNYGQVLVVPNSSNPMESGRKYLEFELYNELGGVIDIDSVDDQVFNGRRTFLGNPDQGDDHFNDGTFNVSNTTNLIILGNSFTNNGTVNGSGVFGGRQFISQTPLIGGAQFINNGTVNENGTNPADKLVFGTPVSGDGSFTGNIEFQDRYAPGNSPAIVNVEDITLTDTATLEMEIGGLTPGTQHDQLIVSGTATLGGRLDLPLINGFVPTMNELNMPITIIDTTGTGILTPGFREATSLNLPENVAIQVTEGANSVTVTFVDPDLTNDYRDDTINGNWGDSSIWITGVPESNQNADLLNASATTNNTVTVNVDAFANELDVDGGVGTMRLIIPTTKSLSVINSIDVDNNGIVELTGGTLLSGSVDVNDGGVLMGTGEVVGKLNVGSGGAGEGMFKPDSMSSAFQIEGDYQQESNGTLVIDVTGDTAGEFDTLAISGNAELGGKLQVVLSDPTDLQAGDTIEIATAGSMTPGEVFEDIEAIGLAAGLYAVPVYQTSASSTSSSSNAATTPGIEVFVRIGEFGDMNGDTIFNEVDVALFTLGLTDPDRYEDDYSHEAVIAGDVSDDGSLDFDDIALFAAKFPSNSQAQVYAAISAALTVPEPGTLTIAFLAFVFAANVRFGSSLGEMGVTLC